jgi:hypothetical protein
MRRPSRPSAVHGPLRSTSTAPRPDPQPPAQEPQRGIPRGLVAAGVVALALLVGGAGLSAPGGDPAPAGPLVDVVTEDQAVAAFALFNAEVDAVEALAPTADVYAPPGPGAAAEAAQEAADEVSAALANARGLQGADPRAAAYWSNAEHHALLDALRDSATLAREIALLAAAHDTLYDGSGAIPLHEAQQQLTSLFGTGVAPAALQEWGRALLVEIDGGTGAGEALRARGETEGLWAQRVTSLGVAAEPALRAYVAAIAPQTVSALRGHPVAGRALDRLGTTGGP